jgi:amidase
VVEEATPDLAIADEIFETLRAWNFELVYADLLRTKRDRLKETVVWNIEQGAALSGPDVGRAERRRTELFHRMRAFLERHDFLVCPVTQVMPFDLSREYPDRIEGVAMESYLDWMKSCYRISATTLPALSVPAGFSAAGLPVGLQIVGPWQQDFAVLQLGHAFEQATGHHSRRPPVA